MLPTASSECKAKSILFEYVPHFKQFSRCLRKRVNLGSSTSDSVFHAPVSLGIREVARSAHSLALKESVTLLWRTSSHVTVPPGDTGSFTSTSPLPLHKNEMINPNQQSINPEMSRNVDPAASGELESNVASALGAALKCGRNEGKGFRIRTESLPRPSRPRLRPARPRLSSRPP